MLKKKKVSTVVNCDVLKLVSDTFSKMLFLFIISSLFLPYPVYKTVRLIDRRISLSRRYLLSVEVFKVLNFNYIDGFIYNFRKYFS